MKEAREEVGGWVWVGLGGLVTLLVPLWLLLTASFIQLEQFAALGGGAEFGATGGPDGIVIDPTDPRPEVWPFAAYWAAVSLLFGIPIGLVLGTAAIITRLFMDRRAHLERVRLDAMTQSDAVLSGVEMVTRGRGSPTGPGPALVLADIPTRLLAFLVDAGLALVAAAPVLLLNRWMLAVLRPDVAPETLVLAGRVAVVGLLLLLALLVMQVVGELRTGQSIGKRWFGIRVAQPTGEVPNALQVIFLRRWTILALTVVTSFIFLLVAPSLTIVGALFWPAIDGLAWLGPDRRALHDQWAGTVVVNAAGA